MLPLVHAKVARSTPPNTKVKGRAHRGFLNPPTRELLSQQASEMNVQPMPLLPRSSSVQLPPPAQWLPSARHFAEEADVDDSAWFEA